MQRGAVNWQTQFCSGERSSKWISRARVVMNHLLSDLLPRQQLDKSLQRANERVMKLFKLCNIKQRAIMAVVLARVSIIKVLMLLWRGAHTSQLTCQIFCNSLLFVVGVFFAITIATLRHSPIASCVGSYYIAAHWAFGFKLMCFSNFMTRKKKSSLD